MKRSLKIMELYYEGAKPAEIAKELSCSIANVCQTIKRKTQWDNTVTPLAQVHVDWLVDTAERHGVKPAALASKLLANMIEVYMDKEMNK